MPRGNLFEGRNAIERTEEKKGGVLIEGRKGGRKGGREGWGFNN
jgi:hypothetical protein